MEKERKLYDKFVDVLNEKLDNPEISAKELDVIANFLKNNNIQATTKHKGLKDIAEKASNILPFDSDEIPERKRK